MYDGLCAMFAWWMYSVCPVVCPVVGITDLLPRVRLMIQTENHLLACLLHGTGTRYPHGLQRPLRTLLMHTRAHGSPQLLR